MFLQFKNANTIHYKKSFSCIVVKKMNTKKSSVHGSSVLTVINTVGLALQALLYATYENSTDNPEHYTCACIL